MEKFLSQIIDVGKQPSLGKIRLGHLFETFELNTINWTAAQYMVQWRHAANYALEKREVSCFFKSYEKPDKSTKMLWLYNVIPKELSDSLEVGNELEQGFYLTEQFIFVADDVKTLCDDSSFKAVEEAMGNKFPIYFLDEGRLETFYLYLSNQVQGIESWEISNEDLTSFLS